MLAAEHTENEVLPPAQREALRTLLAQLGQPYLDIPGDAEGPGLCIGSSLSELRRHIEAQYQARLNSQPRVSPSYTLGRRRLPDHTHKEAATQTERISVEFVAGQVVAPPSNSRAGTPSIESTSEILTTGLRGGRSAASRVICSSSSDASPPISPPRSQLLPSQGESSIRP